MLQLTNVRPQVDSPPSHYMSICICKNTPNTTTLYVLVIRKPCSWIVEIYMQIREIRLAIMHIKTSS
jgi:hypothetical protein